MAVKKYHIIAVQNGRRMGYIKSFSKTEFAFTLTQNVLYAKSYKTEEKAFDDIEYAAQCSMQYVYITE